jgi:hypothetical protein
LIAAAIVTAFYITSVVNRRLADAIATADRDDPYWRLNDLMAHREPVPDGENSAIVLADALDLLPDNWPALPNPPAGQPKPAGSEVMKAYDQLTATPDNIRLDDAVADVLRCELKKYDEAVVIARTVADRPRGRHELEIGPTVIDTLLSETQAARGATRLLAADAAIRSEDGDADGALDSCRAILGVARSIGDEPTLISQLVHTAIGETAIRAMRRALAQGEPSEAALARLQDLVLDELGQPLLLHGIRGERAMLTELIRRVGTGEVPISALSDARTKFDPNAPRTAMTPWGQLWFEYQRAILLEWMNRAVAIARRPAHERPALWMAWQSNIDRVRQSRLGPFTVTLPILLVPAISVASVAISRYPSGLGATAILLAAERHRRKAAHWPLSIAAIYPNILPSPPVDPFSGKSFRMERHDGQIFIYSIGPNGQDEHSAYDPKRWGKGGPVEVGASAWDVPLRRRRHQHEDKKSRTSQSP